MGLELNGNESIITYKDNTSTAFFDPAGERQILKNTHDPVSDGTNNYTGVHFKGDRTNQPWEITQKININKTHSYTILTVTDFGSETSLSATSTIEGVYYSVRIYKPFYNAENNVTTVTFETAGTFTSSADFEATIISYSNFVEHSIILNNDTKINGNLTCDGFNIGTLSQNSNIGTLNSNLTINNCNKKVFTNKLFVDNSGFGFIESITSKTWLDKNAKEIYRYGVTSSWYPPNSVEQGDAHASTGNAGSITLESALDQEHLYLLNVEFTQNGSGNLRYFLLYIPNATSGINDTFSAIPIYSRKYSEYVNGTIQYSTAGGEPGFFTPMYFQRLVIYDLGKLVIPFSYD